jgi:hypothetical protein
MALVLGHIFVPPQVAHAGAQTRAMVAATDFGGPGRLADIAFGPPRTVTPNVAILSSDPVLRYGVSRLYVVNRSGADNIQILDPSNGYALVRQFSVGNGSNPHDIQVVRPDKAYVTRYDSADLWIVNPETGEHTGTISLAAFADEDGIPEMDHLAYQPTSDIADQGRLFVTVQRLDRSAFYAPTDSSQVVVIDTGSDTLIDVDPAAPGVQGILLPHQNPFSEIQAAGPHFLVGCSGAFGVADGGIVRIAPFALTATTEISEAALGGDLNDFAIHDGMTGYAVVSDASFNTHLKSYHRIDGIATGTPFSTSGFSIADIEINDRAELWLCDRTLGNPGVRVFDASSGAQLTTSPLSTGLPPIDIAFDATASGVGVPEVVPTDPAFGVRAAFPNPSAGSIRMSFHLGGAADVSFEIFDLGGRRVRGFALGRLEPGEHQLDWDGSDESGVFAPAGIYFMRLRVGSQSSQARVVRF